MLLKYKMKKIKCISFLLFFVLGMSNIGFTACNDNNKDSNGINTPTSIPVTGLSLDKTALVLTVGSTYTLTATITPINATDKTVEWTSYDTTTVTIVNGKIIAKKVGTVTICAKSGLKSNTCVVNIYPAVASISLDKTTINLLTGETQVSALIPTIKPDEAIVNTITWTSSDVTKATVSDGKITALAVGNAIITAKAGDKTATCTVSISKLQTSGSITINGVNWATCNVNTPGTFTSSPESYGRYYQWNSNVVADTRNGWLSSWKGGYRIPSSTDIWTDSNDPSPVDFRLPTNDEIKTLFDNTKVTNTWTSFNYVCGCKFIDNTTGNAIFLPAYGFLSHNSGKQYFYKSGGYYWNSTDDYCFLFHSQYVGKSYSDRADALTIRSVVK
jgi:uncharacterized protein (TIGR02145 family)